MPQPHPDRPVFGNLGQRLLRAEFTYKTNLSSITSSKCSSQTLSLTITNKNRGNSGYTYDNAGNLIG